MRGLNDEKEKRDTKKDDSSDLVSMISMAMDKPELRAVAIYGDINEERASEAIYGMLAMDITSKSLSMQEDPEAEPIEIVEPFIFYLSSYGGQATEMFAVYDVMRDIRERTPIHTYGVGKVMSAGVLLLASGTKGARKIGRK